MPVGIARRPVAGLVPAARNARTHSATQVAAIAASMVEYGFNNPVLIDQAGSIIAGHGRILAAQQLGLPEVPVVVLGQLTETQRRAYLLADNRLAELAGWDEPLLAAELAALGELDVDLSVLGFTPEDLAALMAPSTVDPFAEWQGMPEFEQARKEAFQTIAVHLKDQAAVEAFSRAIGQPIGPKTRFLWVPPVQRAVFEHQQYESWRPAEGEQAVDDVSPAALDRAFTEALEKDD